MSQENVLEPLVIAVSSRALFNLEKEHQLFEKDGVASYRAYQESHRDEPLEKGVAFPFVQRLLTLNTHLKKLNGDKDAFRVVVLSRNSPESGERFFCSCRHYNLPICSGAFTSGHSTFPYLSAFGVSLFLSANKENVIQAVNKNQPAGWVMQNNRAFEDDDEGKMELRIAFDFDGVIINDDSERQFKEKGLSGFQDYEQANAAKPHGAGPLKNLFLKLAAFQNLDALRGEKDPYFEPAIRIAIVTSRGAPSEQRLITTLQEYGMHAAELFLMDGHPKDKVLEAFRPHIYFDDQLTHLEASARTIPSVLIPFGIRNEFDK